MQYSKTSNRRELQEGFVEFIDRVNPNIFLTLNTDKNHTSQDLSKIIKRLFHKAECRVYGYKHRQRSRYHCRIRRFVTIEHALDNSKQTHAHVLVRNVENFTEKQLLHILRQSYAEVLAEQKYEEKIKSGILVSLSKKYFDCKAVKLTDAIRDMLLKKEQKIAKSRVAKLEPHFTSKYYFDADTIRNQVSARIYCTKEIYEMNSDALNLDASFFD